MREPRPILGARTPLFERLVDTDRTARREGAPLRVLDRAGLLASVAREIGRLLNTRRPDSPHRGEKEARRGERSGEWVLDYGVPDFGGRSAASAPDRESYAAELERALLAFEPRIRQVRVRLTQAPGEPLRLVGSLSAQIQIGKVREPVAFPLLLHAGSGEARLGTAGASAPEATAPGPEVGGGPLA